MKKVISLFLVILVFPIFGFTQSIENLDYISPFHDGLAAIKKNNEWAFINTNGEIVIDFRNDLVTTKYKGQNYPIFVDRRCLIEQKKEGISYFGYINTSGKNTIELQFLNATNFNNGKAIALELVKETAGKNEALGKTIVYYKYYEVTIDTMGIVDKYLTQKGVNVVIDKKFLKKPPQITAKRISDNLYAMKRKDNTWTIINRKD